MGTAYVMEIMCMRAYIGELLVCKQAWRHEEGPYVGRRSPGLIVHADRSFRGQDGGSLISKDST